MKNASEQNQVVDDDGNNYLFKRNKYGFGFAPATKKSRVLAISFAMIIICIINYFTWPISLLLCALLSAGFFAFVKGRLI